MIRVTSNAGELNQKVSMDGAAITLSDFLYDLLGLGGCIWIVGPQTLINPLLVGADPLPSGYLTKTAVGAGVDIGIDSASA